MTLAAAVRARGPFLIVLGLSAAAGALAVIAHHPWQWSLIDDPLQVLQLRRQTDLHGTPAGVLVRLVEAARADWHWGLFRPGYWVYQSTFYLLSATAARAVRGFLLGIALLVPLGLAYRHTGGSRPYRLAVLVWAGAVLACNSWLWDNLSWASLQELPGIALVAVGLGSRRSSARLLTWTGAAWFKAPFAWLLCAWAVVLWRQGRRGTAAAALGIGVATLLAAGAFARHGLYTQALGFHPHAILLQAQVAWNSLWPTLAALVIGAFLLGIDLNAVLPPRGRPGLVAAGGLLYLANLLVWKAGAYYAVAPVWLLAVAGILAAAESTRTQRPAGIRRVTAALAAVMVIGYQFAVPTLRVALHRQVQRDSSVAGVVSFAEQLPAGTVIGVNGYEAAPRLEQILALSGYEGRHIHFVVVTPAHPADRPFGYYVQLADQGSGDPALMFDLVVRLPRAAIYRIGAS